jgi:hypothetical protein
MKQQHQGLTAIAHFLQRQDALRSLSGTDTKAATSIVTVEHQHGVSKLPLLAGAQSFDSPQTGQTRLGFGNMAGCRASATWQGVDAATVVIALRLCVSTVP